MARRLDLRTRGIPHLFILKDDGTLVEEGHPMKLFTDEKLRELSVKNGWHKPRNQRFDHCGLRVAARVRPVGGGVTCADEF